MNIITDNNNNIVRRASVPGFVSTSTDQLVTKGKVVDMPLDKIRETFSQNFSKSWGMTGDALTECVDDEVKEMTRIANAFEVGMNVKLNKSSIRQIA